MRHEKIILNTRRKASLEDAHHHCEKKKEGDRN